MSTSQPTTNYKGILLSNRPANASASQNAHTSPKKATNGGQIPFMPSGIVRDPHIGLPPSHESHTQHASAKHHLTQKHKFAPQLSVTYQHKQYLRELQAQKREEREEQEMNKERDAERRAKFQESQKQLRNMMREANYTEKEIKTFLKTGKMPVRGGAEIEDTTAQATSPRASTKKSKKPKPAWLTEHKKKTTSHQHDDTLSDDLNAPDELDDLLDFANNLDFDEFIDDFEVREALAVIHSRVREMEEELTEEERAEREQQRKMRIEESRQRGAELRSTMGNTASGLAQRLAHHDREWDSSTRVNEQERLANGSTSMTENLLRADDTLKQIHSKQSIKAVAEKAQTPKPLTMNEAEQQVERLMEAIHKERAQRGVVVTHSALNARGEPSTIEEIAAHVTPEDRTRILTKLRKDPTFVQNLPYMYRCPSI